MRKVETALKLLSMTSGNGPDFAGHWKNELGSKMFLAVVGNKVSGSYTTAKSGSGKSLTGDVAGFVNGDLISFVVAWPVAAITAWVGQLTTAADGSDVLDTLWQMTQNVADAEEPDDMWASINAGADQFGRE
ncbi:MULTISPECIES: avidin/streptavidin family protein [unclassified Mesorhizobium]|uniref:avidin/streptavidin family protein n=1 Tax=unclassified Mesorhizobium TaxID=325217 RepID=UPI0003CE4342|nr:avidin/streptavidin family protein [Mesorhizobium sp. LSJC255A00]ESX20899.1 avidin [Mesorhizobium sp. LSJC255A00]